MKILKFLPTLIAVLMIGFPVTLTFAEEHPERPPSFFVKNDTNESVDVQWIGYTEGKLNTFSASFILSANEVHGVTPLRVNHVQKIIVFAESSIIYCLSVTENDAQRVIPVSEIKAQGTKMSIPESS